MIEQLNGTHETVHHLSRTHLKLYMNDECEHYPPHWHTDMEVLCPTEGTYCAICEGATYHLDTGDILFIDGGAIHDLPASLGKRIIFQISWAPVLDIVGIQTVLNRIHPCFLVTSTTLPMAYPQVYQDLLDICSLYQENFLTSEASIYAKSVEMLSLIDRNLQQLREEASPSASRSQLHRHNEEMQAVCSYIREHCAEDISLEQAASLAGFSRFYFARLFRSYTDMSFHQYLISKRISVAEELLVETRLTITEIAMQAGFSNNAAFCKAFRQARGTSPTMFRKLYNDTNMSSVPLYRKE
jgi:AraC-like DNA-binding protein